MPNAHGKKPHISPSTAGINAMNEASSKLGKEIVRQLIQKWSTSQSNFIMCYVVLKNADFMSYTMFETFLKAQTVSGNGKASVNSNHHMGNAHLFDGLGKRLQADQPRSHKTQQIKQSPIGN